MSCLSHLVCQTLQLQRKREGGGGRGGGGGGEGGQNVERAERELFQTPVGSVSLSMCVGVCVFQTFFLKKCWCVNFDIILFSF